MLAGHEGILNFARFAAGGARVVTGGQDQTLRVFDARSGEELRVLELDGIPHAAAVSPDGQRFAVADQRSASARVASTTSPSSSS